MYLVNPYSVLRKTGRFYHASLTIKGRPVAKLSGFRSLEHARQEGQAIADRLNRGEITLDEVKEQRSSRFMGLTQQQWADKLGVSRNAVYQGAKRHGISWEEWVVRRLPLGERKAIMTEE
jgi:predicted DNA-binding protein (UPF0251 family)